MWFSDIVKGGVVLLFSGALDQSLDLVPSSVGSCSTPFCALGIVVSLLNQCSCSCCPCPLLVHHVMVKSLWVGGTQAICIPWLCPVLGAPVFNKQRCHPWFVCRHLPEALFVAVEGCVRWFWCGFVVPPPPPGRESLGWLRK